MRLPLALVALFSVFAVTLAEAAIEVCWEVSNSSQINGHKPGTPSTPAPHGLWTNTFIASGSDSYKNYFNIQPGTKLIQNLSDNTATLTGTAINLDGLTATIALNLSGFLDVIDSSKYKAGGGPYNGATQDFYSTVTGTISIESPFDDLDIVSAVADTYFQMGPGANDKEANEYGASTWLVPKLPNGNTLPHWDLNLVLEQCPEGQNSPAPEPTTFLVWAGLACSCSFSAKRRR